MKDKKTNGLEKNPVCDQCGRDLTDDSIAGCHTCEDVVIPDYTVPGFNDLS